ncbi:hypothetical protein [Pseudomonas sp. A34-9]|uniref:hypothetical protein n=1 Tax=Pseudomonas sp. A34-9 TaxID=3034675 RepID=UPI00240E68F4|nr:hypothetical protein [Pseudomonas sp. A34-9]
MKSLLMGISIQRFVLLSRRFVMVTNLDHKYQFLYVNHTNPITIATQMIAINDHFSADRKPAPLAAPNLKPMPQRHHLFTA